MNGVTNGAMLRQKMGDLLNLVRFPLFTLPELVNGPMEVCNWSKEKDDKILTIG